MSLPVAGNIALLSSSKSSLATASVSQVKDILTFLKDDELTISNDRRRPIMVPLTTKAFFAGSIPLFSSSNVFLKLSADTMVEMSPKEARTTLEQRILVLETSTNSSSLNTPASFPKSQGEKLLSKSGNSDADKGFFEIREELDAEGRQIRSEVINVAKELAYMEKKQREDPVDPLRSGKDKPSSFEEDANEDDQNINQKKIVSEAEYQRIVDRLDELAIMEERSEHTKKVNLMSSRKLQGSGWNRGFLKTKSNKKIMATNNSNSLTSQKKVKSGGADIDSTSAAAPQPGQTKSVGFDANRNEVKEIPRVGEKPFARTSPPSLAPSRTPTDIKDRPMVAIGLVQEKPGASRRPISTSQTSAASPKSSENPPPKKRMSKFAKERMEQRS